MEVIRAGSLLIVSTGEYSDYSVDGVFRAKSDIDPEALRSEWLALHPEQTVRYCFRDEQFLAWVAGKGLLEPIDCTEWHLGDYCYAEDMWTNAMRNDTASD